MDAWQRLGDYGVGREEPMVLSQSVIGEKYLATELQWTLGNGLGDYGVGREEPIVPSQSVIGEKYLASTVQSKSLPPAWPAESAGSVRTQQRKSVRFPSQSAIGEINRSPQSFRV